mgnify:CR=1 FL=1
MSTKPNFSLGKAVTSFRQGQAVGVKLTIATKSWFKMLLSYGALLLLFEFFYFGPLLMIVSYKFPTIQTTMTMFNGNKVTVAQWLHYSLILYLSPIIFILSREWRVFYAPSFLMTSFVFHALSTYVCLVGVAEQKISTNEGMFFLPSAVLYVVLSITAYFKRRAFLERVSFRKNITATLMGSNVLFVPPGER